METLIGHQTPKIILSEENKQKVSLIKDINSIFRLTNKGKNLTPDLFDILYDGTIAELEQTFLRYRHMYNMASITT